MAKICNIIQGTNLGGMEQASLRLMTSLKEHGHSWEVVSLNLVGGLGPLLAEQNIPVSGLPYKGRGGWRSVSLFRRTLRSIKADALIMTGHNLLAMLVLGDYCSRNRILAIHFHHKGVKPSWQWRLIYYIACKRFQAITFPSDFVRLEAERIYPPIKRISHTVYNPLPERALPIATQRVDARLALELPLEVPLIGNAGWLIPRKRFDVFLRTAHRVLQELPNVIFVIAGGGEERPALEALALKLGISSNIRWIGWQKDMIQFYHCLDVLLFNSDWDALATTPLEALINGVPLVASCLNGGLREILNSDDYGFLLQAHDIGKLSDHVIEFVKDPSYAQTTMRAGRERVLSLSNSQSIARSIESLLDL